MLLEVSEVVLDPEGARRPVRRRPPGRLMALDRRHLRRVGPADVAGQHVVPGRQVGRAGLQLLSRPVRPVLRKGCRAIESAGFILDYLEARHAETLAPADSNKDGPIRLLVAAKIGKTRLIDNVGV